MRHWSAGASVTSGQRASEEYLEAIESAASEEYLEATESAASEERVRDAESRAIEVLTGSIWHHQE